MSDHITLHQYWRSSCSWRLRWALNIKKINYKINSINLLQGQQKSPEYLALNPMGLVPSLEINSKVYTESGAILEYLEERYPEPALLPKTAEERLLVRRLAQIIASGTQPIQNLAVQIAHGGADKDKRAEWARLWIGKGFHAYETFVGETFTGKFSFGDHVTLADLCLIPQVYNANRVNLDMSTFPKISQIYQNCMVLEECIQASPEMQPDAVQ